MDPQKNNSPVAQPEDEAQAGAQPQVGEAVSTEPTTAPAVPESFESSVSDDVSLAPEGEEAPETVDGVPTEAPVSVEPTPSALDGQEPQESETTPSDGGLAEVAAELTAAPEPEVEPAANPQEATSPASEAPVDVPNEPVAQPEAATEQVSEVPTTPADAEQTPAVSDEVQAGVAAAATQAATQTEIQPATAPETNDSSVPAESIATAAATTVATAGAAGSKKTTFILIGVAVVLLIAIAAVYLNS